MKRSRINSVSKKRQKDNRRYLKLRDEFLKANPVCQCVKTSGAKCLEMATQIHHRKGRGKFYLCVASWMAVCHDCHEYIEYHRSWSKDRGYLLNRASSAPIFPLSHYE